MLDSILWVMEDEMGVESGVVQAIFGAVRAGMDRFMDEFIYFLVMVKRTDVLYEARDGERRNVLMCAVQHRQPEVFGLIFKSLKDAEATVLSGRDNEGNNILHVAGTLTEFSPLDHITGAALKMQTELQWFQVSTHPSTFPLTFINYNYNYNYYLFLCNTTRVHALMFLSKYLFCESYNF